MTFRAFLATCTCSGTAADGAGIGLAASASTLISGRATPFPCFITVVAPDSTWPRLRFIALHMICVRIRPEAPTTAPMQMSSGLFTAKPEMDAATPENEFRSDTAMGMSAPPTLIVNSTP